MVSVKFREFSDFRVPFIHFIAKHRDVVLKRCLMVHGKHRNTQINTECWSMVSVKFRVLPRIPCTIFPFSNRAAIQSVSIFVFR